MKRFLSYLLFLLTLAQGVRAQERTVQNRPYTDLRPFHFGILVGTNLQDLEFNNIGPQVFTDDQGVQHEYIITADQDRWDNGFQVGVLGELRINNSFQFRLAPALYFGSRHVSFHNMNPLGTDSLISRVQNLKSVYIGCAADLIFSAQRFNNHRPYVMMGFNPMINLSGSESDYLKLKRYDLFFEAGLGCDFYLPFFKFRPELKFMYGLTNSLETNHANHIKDKAMLPYTLSVNKARSKMIVVTVYFE
ncbi:MAG: PorT family protein [Prevotella sp.]|nr:PorT family protein [Prevotella sp.]